MLSSFSCPFSWTVQFIHHSFFYQDFFLLDKCNPATTNNLHNFQMDIFVAIPYQTAYKMLNVHKPQTLIYDTRAHI